jgi:hypothetical protein
MHTLTTNRIIITCLLIAVLSGGSIFWLYRLGKNSRVIGHAGTIQANDSVKQMVDSPRDAYQIWKGAGYRGRTIVFVADRWESFDPGELIPAQMFRTYPLQLFNTAKLLEEEHLNGITFLYVASLNKICRRIVAIVPEKEFGRMKEMSRASKDRKISDREVYVSRQGFPRWFATGASFAGVGEPALLYIGASYFKNAEPEELFRQLSASGLLTDCIILCNEKGKDGVTPHETAKMARFGRLIGIATSSAEVHGELPFWSQAKLRTMPIT